METIKVDIKDVLQTFTGEQIQVLNPEGKEALDKVPRLGKAPHRYS